MNKIIVRYVVLKHENVVLNFKGYYSLMFYVLITKRVKFATAYNIYQNEQNT
jgi:hypothetical protein